MPSRQANARLNLSFLGWSVVTLVTLLQACSADPELPARREQRHPPSARPDAGVASPAEPLCPPSNPFCAGNPVTAPEPADVPAPSACEDQPIDLTPAGINIMVAVDGSASMATHWHGIQDAIMRLRDEYPGSSFGIQIFWGELVKSVEEGTAKNNWCGKVNNRVLDVGTYTSTDLLDFLGDTPPGPDFVGGLFETSPVVQPLNYFLENATALADPSKTNYLLLLTDGNDNCFGSVFSLKEDKLLAYQKLAIELGKKNIRTLPVGFDAASRPGGTGNFGTVPADTDLDVLATLLEYGGSGLTEVPKVDDPSKLAEVIAQVGRSVRNCRFEIPAALDPTQSLNPFELSFTINGVVVPRDRRGSDGWNFIQGNTSQVELYGQACQAVRADASLEARKTCSTDVCGTAALAVETRPRAVLMLLDSSASRIECADGTADCLVPPGIGIDRTLSYWEVVEHAVGNSLAAPVNDDVDFGMQFFPGKKAQSFSCDVASEPEIPAADGTEISIMQNMLEKLPFGFSPVVGVLESVAAAPGRLAEPGVLGSVVMLTDGGDNCAEDDTGIATQDEIVERLGAAAKSLYDHDVKTYVVRYGSDDGRTDEQDAQLRAIVANGGTASSDPKTPFIEARDATELNAALASISDQLATCSFTVGDLGSDADKSKANLYLNGEIIPFDAAGTKQDGWAWIDAEQTAAELYGNACSAFKTNRRTSLVLEFGCVPVVLL